MLFVIQHSRNVHGWSTRYWFLKQVLKYCSHFLYSKRSAKQAHIKLKASLTLHRFITLVDLVLKSRFASRSVRSFTLRQVLFCTNVKFWIRAPTMKGNLSISSIITSNFWTPEFFSRNFVFRVGIRSNEFSCGKRRRQHLPYLHFTLRLQIWELKKIRLSDLDYFFLSLDL